MPDSLSSFVLSVTIAMYFALLLCSANKSARGGGGTLDVPATLHGVCRKQCFSLQHESVGKRDATLLQNRKNARSPVDIRRLMG